MPRISQFLGISIYMYYRDHPPAHFHAIYGEFEAQIEVASGTIMEGDLPRRVRGLVEEWTQANREQLQRNWNLARASQPLEAIPPLE